MRRSARELNRTLCRCMTYYRVQAAIKRGARMIADAPGGFGEGGGGVTTFTNVPKHIEEELEKSTPDAVRAGIFSRERVCLS